MSYQPKVLKRIDEIKDVVIDIMLDNIEGLNYEEAEYYLINDAEPSIGSVNGLIYYSETEQIACEFYEEIIEYASDIYGDNIPIDLVKSLNNMTWFIFNSFRYEDFIKEVLEKAIELNMLKPIEVKRYLVTSEEYNKIKILDFKIYKNEDELDEHLDGYDYYIEIDENTKFKGLQLKGE